MNQTEHEKLQMFVAQCSWSQGPNKEKEQETYSEVNDESVWKNEWEVQIALSHGSRHSKGVCILINPPVNSKIVFSF